MSNIERVAIAGATGNLGPAVLRSLADANFDVTVLARKGGKKPEALPSNVKIVDVDYDSRESVEAALQGQDAVVSTLNDHIAYPAQRMLIDVAAAIGVQRFLPSEYGCDYTRAGHLPAFKPKMETRRHLEELSRTSSLSYTLVTTGAFLDWGINVGFLLNLDAPLVELYDSGSRVWSATTVPTIANAIASVLKHPDETKNRNVFVSEAEVTQKQILNIVERASGRQRELREVSTEQLEAIALEEIKKENPDLTLIAVNLIHRAIFGPDLGGHYEAADNELLGIRKLTDTELEAVVRKSLP